MKFNKKLAALGLSMVMAVGSIVPVMAAENVTVTQYFDSFDPANVYTVNNVLSKSAMVAGEDLSWKVFEDNEEYSEFLAFSGTELPVYTVASGKVITVQNANKILLYPVKVENNKLYVSYDDIFANNLNSLGGINAVPTTSDHLDVDVNKLSGDVVLGEEGYYLFHALLSDPLDRVGTMSVILNVKADATEPTEPEKPVEPTTPSFTDVKTTDYFYNAVNWAVENKVTAGTSATTFSPNDTCTNAQIITYIWIANGSKTTTKEAPYKDVPADAYYAKAAAWAYENGIVTTDNFNPDGACSRLSTMQFLWRAAGQPLLEDLDLPFEDVKSDDLQAVAWALQNKITAGTSATTFSPEDTCTRGQIMTFLYNNYAK